MVLTLSWLLVPAGWPQMLLAVAILATVVWQGLVNHRRTDELIYGQHQLMTLAQELRGQQLLVQQQNETLAAMVDTRTAELREANMRLAAANLELLELDKLRSAMLSNVSHELRTPLTGILGSAQNLRDGLAGELSDTQREYVQMIESDSGRLIRVVNELLEWGRLEAGRIQLQRSPLALQPLVDEVFMLLRSSAECKGVRLEQRHGVPYAEADRDKLKQVLINLVDNAVKFSPSHSTVTLCTEATATGLHITVEDQGAGISAADAPHVFERFFRGRAGDGTAGSGLGLAIARNLVRLHGGDITLQSSHGQGSTFVVSLPNAGAAT